MFKIAISGPESTGKTEIARQLAEYFAGQWIPEFAREYIEKLGRTYTYEDVCVIAEQQILEQKSFKNDDSPGFIFFDTDLIITKVWFEYCFAKVPGLLTEQLNKNYFDFYLAQCGIPKRVYLTMPYLYVLLQPLRSVKLLVLWPLFQHINFGKCMTSDKVKSY